MAIEGDGRRLDRFELVAELATGGMATVYLARLSGVGGFQRFTAIKRLHPHLAREPEFIEMFLEEARLAARIHHPNVVPILEIGTSDEGYYIVMEYVEGDTLGRLLARSAQTGTRLPTKVGLRVMIDMLAGLDAAHELKDDNDNPLGIVHRDISPQNVLVGVDGSARLSDFGVARATSKLSTTRTGQLKGKLAYMAPEQARGTRDIDRRADIFAAGVVLWEVLACRRLFKGDGEADTLNKVLNEPIPPVRSAAPMVPAALEAVVARALERDRAKRYATAAEFADALERASRVVGALGTHKDVAAHLEVVLGTEISQQREAVRAWLSRSEPSKHGHEGRPDLTSVTKVEGRGEGSSPGSLPRLGAASSASGVSSVSASVASVRLTEPVDADGAAADPNLPVLPSAGTRDRRARVWPWAMAAALAVLVAGAWLRFGHTASPTPMPLLHDRPPLAAAVPPAAVVAPVAPSTPTPSAATTTSPSPPGASASETSSPAPSPAHVGAAARPGRAVPTGVAPPPSIAPATAPAPAPSPVPPVPTPAAPAVPDDISRNPYR